MRLKYGDLWKEGLLFLTAALIIYQLLDNLAPLWEGMQGFVQVLRPFITAFLIAYVLNAPIRAIQGFYEKLGFGKAFSLSILTVYLLAGISIGGIGFYLLPILVSSVWDFLHQLPAYASGFVDGAALEHTPVVVDFFVRQVDSFLGGIFSLDGLFAHLGSGLNSIGEYARSMTAALVNLLLGIVISIYFLVYQKGISDFFQLAAARLIKEPWLGRMKNQLRLVNSIVQKFVLGQLLDGLIIASLTFAVYGFLGVPYALVLSLLLLIANLIPYVGTLTATAAAVAITLFSSGYILALIVLVFQLLLQQVDANIINPKIISDALDLNPILILLAVTIGGAYGGIMGLFLAVPIMAYLKAAAGQILAARPPLGTAPSKTSRSSL